MKISIRLLTCLTAILLASVLWAQDIDPDTDLETVEDFIDLAGQEAEALAEEVLDAVDSALEVAEDAAAGAAIEAPTAIEPAAAQPVSEALPSGTMDAPLEPRTYRIQAHPIFIPEQAESVYRPLVNYLNAVTPHRFELQIPRDFHRFWLDIRRGGQPDLVLEDAHLIAMRIARQGYAPLVRASEPGTFSLLTSSMNAGAELSDFVGRPVSSMPAPSLGYLILASWYDNPMQQPIIQSNASSWLDAVEIVFSMEAEAAMVPHNLVARYVNMEVVRTSEPFPHAGIAASPDVPASVQRDVIAALTTLHEDPEHFGALHELDIEQFVPATADEFEGLDRWLQQVFTFF